MKLLALDTATEACSVALLQDGAMLTRYSEPKRGHAELILPMVDEVLKEAGLKLTDLDALAVGRGPGGFTGIRIGVSVAQGLAFGADLPVVLISDLAALAQRAAETHAASAVLACIDARMNEVYWGAYTLGADGLVTPYIEESVGPPEAVAEGWERYIVGSVEGSAGYPTVSTGSTHSIDIGINPGIDQWIGAGTGWAAYPTMSRPRLIDAAIFPRAAEIARLAQRDFDQGKAVPPEQAQPVYLRDTVAWKSNKRAE